MEQCHAELFEEECRTPRPSFHDLLARSRDESRATSYTPVDNLGTYSRDGRDGRDEESGALNRSRESDFEFSNDALPFVART